MTLEPTKAKSRLASLVYLLVVDKGIFTLLNMDSTPIVMKYTAQGQAITD